MLRPNLFFEPPKLNTAVEKDARYTVCEKDSQIDAPSSGLHFWCSAAHGSFCKKHLGGNAAAPSYQTSQLLKEFQANRKCKGNNHTHISKASIMGNISPAALLHRLLSRSTSPFQSLRASPAAPAADSRPFHLRDRHTNTRYHSNAEVNLQPRTPSCLLHVISFYKT